jgi:hypothetical protein
MQLHVTHIACHGTANNFKIPNQKSGLIYIDPSSACQRQSIYARLFAKRSDNLDKIIKIEAILIKRSFTGYFSRRIRVTK